jgi:hypothetical protein
VTAEQHEKPASAASNATWAPLYRLIRLCLALSVPAIAGAYAWLWTGGAPMRWELLLAVGAGIAGTLLLTGALMGLLFVSNQSGHDASVGHAERDTD